MVAKTAFASLISRPSLKKLAGEKYFERGLNYLNEGAVVHLQLGENGISARVQGTEPCPYAVRLWIEKRELQWGCACPLGSEGAFCKHLVATGLAWLAGELVDAESPVDPLTLKTIRNLLEATDERMLAEIVGRRAVWDECLLEELALAARASRHDDPSATRRDRATRRHRSGKHKPDRSADRSKRASRNALNGLK